jgi:hypothetical protein
MRTAEAGSGESNKERAFGKKSCDWWQVLVKGERQVPSEKR